MRAFNQRWVLRGCGSAFCWDFRAVEPEGNVVAFQKREQVFCVFWLVVLYFTTQEILILPGILFQLGWKSPPKDKNETEKEVKSHYSRTNPLSA